MNNIKNLFRKIWNEAGSGYSNPLLFLLYCLSLLYGGAVLLRGALYRYRIFPPKRLRIPVISVGNLTVGGTGKTPAVVMLAVTLRRMGFRPAVLSRGYGGKSRHPVNIVSDGEELLMDPWDAGDEPYLVARTLKGEGIPVMAGRERYLTGKCAVENFGVNLLILDDAFQHLSLARDMDIVLLDARMPFGNGYLLPRGPLRESTSSLNRADLIILTGLESTSSPIKGKGEGEIKDALRKRFPDIPILSGRHKPECLLKISGGMPYPVENIRGRRITAFCGIANPGSFEETILSLGGEIACFIPFPDHHRYSPEDAKKIQQRADESSSEMILTTEKDAVKLIDFREAFHNIFMLRIKMEIDSKEISLEDLIRSRLKK